MSILGLLNLEILISFVGAEADGALDKARKHKKRQLEDTYNLIVKKRKVSCDFIILDCIFFNIMFSVSYS